MTRPDTGLSRKGERAASFVILLLLAAVAAAVLLRGGRKPPSEGEGAAPRPTADAAPSFLPDEIPPGLRRETVKRFGPEDLYEYVNGEAPRYVQFGFLDLFVGRYGVKETPVVAECFDMGDRRHAFAIYRDGLSEELDEAGVGREGYRSGNLVVFWKGPWYVKVRAPVEEDRASEVLAAAKILDGGIEDEERGLPGLHLFPSEGMIEASFTFLPSDAFGHEHLARVFVAEYEGEEGNYSLFFTEAPSEREASAVLEKHADYLKGEGRLETRDADSLWGEDEYMGDTLLLTDGALLVGVAGLEERDRAEAEARGLLKRIKGSGRDG